MNEEDFFDALAKKRAPHGSTYIYEDKTTVPQSPHVPNPRRRNNPELKNATTFDFIKMIEKVMNNILPEVTFTSDDERNKFLSPQHQIDNPIITFKVKSRRPFKEIKPIPRCEIKERTDVPDEERLGALYVQRFKCILQFNIFSSGYAEAEQVMNIFEEAMLKYAYIFKKYGIQEFYFDEQLEDSYYDTYRQWCCVRNITYYVLFEKQSVDFEEIIKSISINGERS